MRRPKLYAGFECARFRNGTSEEHDLLLSTRHLEPEDVQRDRDAFAALGFEGFRDAITPNIPSRLIYRRLMAFKPYDPLILDLFHFEMPHDRVEAEFHINLGLSAIGANNPKPDIVAFNEPCEAGQFMGRSREDCIRDAIWAARQSRRIMDEYGLTGRVIACDPVHHAHAAELDGMRGQVDSGAIGLLGVHYYAHYATARLMDSLRLVRETFPTLPIAITETGFHPGLARPDIEDARQWLRHVEDEIEASGVEVESICYYPVKPMPPWHLTTREAMDVDPWPCGWPMHHRVR